MSWYSSVLPSSKDARTYAGLPRDQDNWTCENWKTYYQNIRAFQNTSLAKSIVQNDAQRAGWFSNLHSCKYNCPWVSYFTGQGLEAGNVFSKIYCAAENTAGAVGGVTQGVNNIVRFATSPLGIAVIVTGIYLWKKKS